MSAPDVPEKCPHCGWPKVERLEYDNVRDFNCGTAYSLQKQKVTIRTHLCKYNALQNENQQLRARLAVAEDQIKELTKQINH